MKKFPYILLLTAANAQATSISHNIPPEVLQQVKAGDYVEAQWRAGLKCQMADFHIIKSRGHQKWVDYAKQEIANMNSSVRTAVKKPEFELSLAVVDESGVFHRTPHLRFTSSVHVGQLGNEDYSILYCDEYSNGEYSWRIRGIVNGSPLSTGHSVDQAFVESLPLVKTRLRYDGWE